MLSYFNSIKVRLELSKILGSSGSAAFQFHKGAIRTKIYTQCIKPYREFQFHKGAIRTSSTR